MEAAGVLLPVLVGIVVGATLISNAVRFALRRFRQATLGVLMGLLLGAVVGLWPFEDPASRAPLQAASALGLAVAGFALTWTISRFGTTHSDPPGRR